MTTEEENRLGLAADAAAVGLSGVETYNHSSLASMALRRAYSGWAARQQVIDLRKRELLARRRQK